MAKDLFPKTTKETLETRVVEEADVIVVGGGPGGHTAAIATAQSQKVGC
jgi:ribulose 1,5-bisphosphate synthetase/thiazole synthase